MMRLLGLTAHISRIISFRFYISFYHLHSVFYLPSTSNQIISLDTFFWMAKGHTKIISPDSSLFFFGFNFSFDRDDDDGNDS